MTARSFRIACIPGDGIGKEVIPAGQAVLEALAAAMGDGGDGFRFAFTRFDWGGDHYRQHGVMMPEDGLDALRDMDAILFGSAGDPDIPDHVTLWGLRLKICQGLDQYANVRPTRILPGIDAPLKRGKRYFYKRRNAKQEKAILYCREGKSGPERALLDPNVWSAEGNWSLNRWVPSWDGEKVAYTVSRNFADEATLYVLDVTTGKRSEIDVIEERLLILRRSISGTLGRLAKERKFQQRTWTARDMAGVEEAPKSPGPSSYMGPRLLRLREVRSRVGLSPAAIYSLIDRIQPGHQFSVSGEMRGLSFAESLYYSVTTVATVGYGDILPVADSVRMLSAIEVVTGILLLLFGFAELIRAQRGRDG